MAEFNIVVADPPDTVIVVDEDFPTYVVVSSQRGLQGPAGTNGTNGTNGIDGSPGTGYVGINAQTGTSYTVAVSDVGKLVTLNNAGAITVTLPQDSAVAISVAQSIDFLTLGTGTVTFVAGTGATVNATPSLVMRARFSMASVVKYAANTWIVTGDLA